MVKIAFKRWFIVVVSAAALAACKGSETNAPAPVASVVVNASATTVKAGKTIKLTAQAKDADGNILSDRPITWSSNNTQVAAVALDGTVSAAVAGTATITATSEGKTADFALTVARASIASIVVGISPLQLTVGQSVQASLTITDSTGQVVTDAVVAWSSNDPSASVSATGSVAGQSVGSARIDARSEGILGSATVTVVAAPQTCLSPMLSLGVGEIRLLTSAEKSAFCVGAGTSSEYAVIPFNNSSVAASTVSMVFNGTNTLAPSAVRAAISGSSPSGLRPTEFPGESQEIAFRQREYRDLQPAFAGLRSRRGRMSATMPSTRITGIPATPTVGDVYPVNSNLSGNTCTAAAQTHPARVIAVLPHIIVLADTLAPAGGYSDTELTAFGQAFENVGYGLDVTNFGSPTDIDVNGRVVVFFTTGVNVIPGPAGGYVAGLFAARDLFPIATCPASAEGEMFYLPVPDPAQTINATYKSKSALASGVLGVLVHELQHLINAGRRIYVNDADSFEEVWLNEGLSHIAEELLYYEESGNSPKSNISLARLQSSQAQLDAVNTYQIQNLARSLSYLEATELNSPYAQNDDLETRGAIWQLLRYSADRTSGNEQNTWFNLVNSTTAGQANFNNVFGGIVSLTRDWSVAQFADDMGFGVDAKYSNPSWNFRSILPAINNGVFPLLTRSLSAGPLSLSLSGGGAAYIRFQVNPGATAALTATSSGQPLPAGVDVFVMRTR